MNDLVRSVKTHLLFNFKDGSKYELPLRNEYGTVDGLTNYGTSIKLDEELYTVSSDNVIGNVSGSTLSIGLRSLDKLLIPNNSSSVYFGMMNDTCYIDVTCEVEGETEIVNMGRYYVDTWEAGSNSKNFSDVSISCIDLMSKIKNIQLKNIRMTRNISVIDYLKFILESVNKELPPHMQILYTDDDLNIYKNSPYEWQMYFNNINRHTLESIFNDISKYTLSYIWIDRDRHLKTDHLLDDTKEVSVSRLDGTYNLFEYGQVSGAINKYNSIKINYINSIAFDDEELLTLKSTPLDIGVNKLNNNKLTSDKVSNIHTVEIKCADGDATCRSFNNFADSMDLEIYSTNKTLADVYVYGSVIKEYYKQLDRIIDEENKSNKLVIENRILRKELIDAYADGVVNLMKMKDSNVYASGFINPKVKRGDVVIVKGKSMNLDAEYKVVGNSYTLGTNYRCKTRLIKTFERKVPSNKPGEDTQVINK